MRLRVFGGFIALLFLAATAKAADVMVITIDGVINPVSAEFVTKSIERAEEANAEAVVIEIDTPGGLDTSMRDIVKKVLGSNVPVITFVYPPGSRAASAGTFILLSGHIAAMSPQTNVGAAHPVGIGERMDKTMAEKATNDAAAYIKSIAAQRKRNYIWAEDAVRKSVSATAEEALKLNVIDMIANDTTMLLNMVDGMSVTVPTGIRTLKTKNASIKRAKYGTRHKILDFISDPNVAYILMLLGFYGLFFELTNPGSILPGVLGGIFLILAFYALQTIPVNYAGLLLIVLALVLFALEVKVTSYGILTIGGIAAMVLGSLMLFEEAGPFFKLSLSLVLPAAILTALFFTLTVALALKALRARPVTGGEGLIGEEGTARTNISKDGGTVAVHGELWSAFSDEDIEAGTKVIVQSVKGLKIKVKKA